MKSQQVRIFSTTGPPTDVQDVVRIWVEDGLYCVKQRSGVAYRFPVLQILFVTEAPSRQPYASGR